MNSRNDTPRSRTFIARSFIAAAALAVGLMGCGGGGGGDDGTSSLEGSRYASWTASMMDATQVRAGTTPVVEVFNNQSVRQVLRLSLGGDRVRIKVSNLFGKAPITVSGANAAATPPMCSSA